MADNEDYLRLAVDEPANLDDLMGQIRICYDNASRLNDGSMSRLVLKRLLAKHDLAVAAALLEWDRMRE